MPSLSGDSFCVPGERWVSRVERLKDVPPVGSGCRSGGAGVLQVHDGGVAGEGEEWLGSWGEPGEGQGARGLETFCGEGSTLHQDVPGGLGRLLAQSAGRRSGVVPCQGLMLEQEVVASQKTDHPADGGSALLKEDR